ncbi:MAG: cytochrome c oxidase subunit II [Acidobacteriota bacterium]
MNDFPLFPRQASTIAVDIDRIYIALVLLCGLTALAIVVTIIVLAFKYRRSAVGAYSPEVSAPFWLEYIWTTVPFFIFMGIFFWGAWVYFRAYRVPEDATDVYAVGKQWMWKFQHEGGQSEINDLHVPVGRPIRMIMASEDVIHSFFIPEFRIHRDVIPSRYSFVWFQATKAGKYHLFCSQYCGTDHSKMIGTVYAMEPEDYQNWLSGGVKGSATEEGEKLFQSLACITCHTGDSSGRGPVLAGLFGTTVMLSDGQRVKADENYLRESILNSTAKVVAGFQPIMPNFQGQVDEQKLIYLIAYIKAMKAPDLNPGAGQQTPTGRGSANPLVTVPKEPGQPGTNSAGGSMTTVPAASPPPATPARTSTASPGSPQE